MNPQDVPFEHLAHPTHELYQLDPWWKCPRPEHNPKPQTVLLRADEERALRLSVERAEPGSVGGPVRPSGKRLTTLPTLEPGLFVRLARRGFMDVWLENAPLRYGPPGLTPCVRYGIVTELGRARLRGHDIAVAASTISTDGA